MLVEWLEQEAQGEMAKTAAQQFEEELAVLDAPSIARFWREAKSKEAQIGQRLMQAIPGSIGGAMGGAGLGAAGAAAAAPSGERFDAAQRGALIGGALGAGGGAIRGAMVNPARMNALNDVRQGAIRNIIEGGGGQSPEQMSQAMQRLTTPASPLEVAGGLAGTAGQVGALGTGLREGAKRRKKEKKKESSVDLMRLAMMKEAGLFRRMGDAVSRFGREGLERHKDFVRVGPRKMRDMPEPETLGEVVRQGAKSYGMAGKALRGGYKGSRPAGGRNPSYGDMFRKFMSEEGMR